MSRLKNYQKKFDKLVEDMQTFCLHPYEPKFREICENGRIKNDDMFPLWKRSVCYFYGFKLDKDEVEEQEGYENFESELCTSFLEDMNNKFKLRQLWTLFFVSGEDKYRDLCYQAIGSKNIKVSRHASELYLNVRNLYNKRILEASHPKFSKIDFALFEKRIKDELGNNNVSSVLSKQ